MKYAFIARHKKTWPVDLMCRLLGVSRNTYSRHCQRQQHRQPDAEHQAMLAAVKDIAEPVVTAMGRGECSGRSTPWATRSRVAGHAP